MFALTGTPRDVSLRFRITSALPPRADIDQMDRDVRFVREMEVAIFIRRPPESLSSEAPGRNYRMTYIVPEIALATRDDILGILDLQEQNLLGRGGLLSVRLPGAFIEAALDDLPQIVARRWRDHAAHTHKPQSYRRCSAPIRGRMMLTFMARSAWRKANAGMGWRLLCLRNCASGCRAANGSICPTRQCGVAASTSENGDERCDLVRA